MNQGTGILFPKEGASGEQPEFECFPHLVKPGYSFRKREYSPGYVVPVSDDDDELLQFNDQESKFVQQRPMETEVIDHASLAPWPLSWHTMPKKSAEGMSAFTEGQRIYCVKVDEEIRVSNVIVYPTDKQHLRGITWAVTLNHYIATACRKAEWDVRWAELNDRPNALAELRQYYGISNGFLPGPAHVFGGYWVEDEMESSELLLRWVITSKVWIFLHPGIQVYVKNFASWGTLKDHNYPPGNNRVDPKEATARVKYTIGGINLLHDDEEDEAQS
ncbi:hypothetical protein P171DRAFT_489669 [Karstenula rhodostoma CBS 690.94]|uniref:Uncharacterized protein n=1 Tax=Karstenula rhodostoma CBS 690.94 TaxID=1392251 RepID=A0A9P4U8B8_9PLEO|nr:hypothetical protein P171DRAFT_489669 [Karstenula rhodostoma CBS 690.94]